MSCHSFARTLMDETGYGAGGRWRGRLPLGVLSPRMSLIGRSRRTLDCRHGEAVLTVAPGARRREYRFSGSSRRPPCLARERDGDVASTMRGIGRASEGDRGLPADCVRPKGSIGVGAVCDHDAGPFGAVGVAGRDQDHPCGDGSDGRLLEAGLARAVPRLQPDSRQRLAHPQRAGPQERRQRRDLDRRPSRPRADPRQFRAAAADPGPARPDPHAARADARDRPSHPADSGDAGGGQHQAGLGHFRHPGLERPAHLEGDRVGPKRPAAAGRTRPSPARLHARGTRRRVGRTLARPSSLPDRSASEDDRTDRSHDREFDARLEAALAPFCGAAERLNDLPGVSDNVAQTVIAEIGVDMKAFPTAGHLPSWAGMCPRLDESAGRKRSRRLRKGAPWLKPVLVQAALAATKVKNSSLRARYFSLRPRLGHKKAIIAVAAAMLRIIYHMLKDGTFYQDLGPDYRRPRNPERAAQSLANRIRSLGFDVEIKKAA